MYVEGNIDSGCYDIDTTGSNIQGLVNTTQFVYIHGATTTQKNHIIVDNINDTSSVFSIKFCNTKLENLWSTGSWPQFIIYTDTQYTKFIDFYVDNCEFSALQNVFDGISNEANFTITDNLFNDTSVAIQHEFISTDQNVTTFVNINNNKFINNKNRLIDLTMHSEAIINVKQNEFIANSVPFTSLLEFEGGSNVYIDNNLFDRNTIGSIGNSNNYAIIHPSKSNISIMHNTFKYNILRGTVSSHISFCLKCGYSHILAINVNNLHRVAKYNTFYFENTTNNDVAYISDYYGGNYGYGWIQSDFQYNNFYNLSQIAYIYYMEYSLFDMNAMNNYYGQIVRNITNIMTQTFDKCENTGKWNEYNDGTVIFWPWLNKPINGNNFNISTFTQCTLQTSYSCNYNEETVCGDNITTTTSPTTIYPTTSNPTTMTPTTMTPTTTTPTTNVPTTMVPTALNLATSAPTLNPATFAPTLNPATAAPSATTLNPTTFAPSSTSKAPTNNPTMIIMSTWSSFENENSNYKDEDTFNIMDISTYSIINWLLFAAILVFVIIICLVCICCLIRKRKGVSVSFDERKTTGPLFETETTKQQSIVFDHAVTNIGLTKVTSNDVDMEDDIDGIDETNHNANDDVEENKMDLLDNNMVHQTQVDTDTFDL
eukprot:109901_1